MGSSTLLWTILMALFYFLLSLISAFLSAFLSLLFFFLSSYLHSLPLNSYNLFLEYHLYFIVVILPLNRNKLKFD